MLLLLLAFLGPAKVAVVAVEDIVDKDLVVWWRGYRRKKLVNRTVAIVRAACSGNLIFCS